MIAPELLKILCCPETHQSLNAAEPALVEKLNQRIAAGDLENRAGQPVKEKLDGGLIRADGKFLYPIRGGIPVVLVDESIPMDYVSEQDSNALLWWLIPGVLAGMPMPFIHPQRRLNRGGALDSYPDELRMLHKAGVRGVVSLLNIPTDGAVYESAGFSYLCLPILDGDAPTFEQTSEFVQFVERHRASNEAVAVHCEAGLGRTGTMLAAYLISQNETADAAIRRVRKVEKVAVETPKQIEFLERFAASMR